MARFTMKNKHIYVAIIRNENPVFVTAIDTDTRTAEWKETKIPYEFHSWDDANYVCLGLMCRGIWAFPVVTSYEMKEPLYKEVNENA